MKGLRVLIILAVVAGLVCGIAAKWAAKREAAKATAASNLAQVFQPDTGTHDSPVVVPSPPEPVEAAPLPLPPAVAEEPSTSLPPPSEPTGANVSPSAKAKPAGTAKKPLTDPEARVALAFVGADPEAEAYWYGAINDPSLPAGERQDLIEDLNEDGLSDPKHPTPDDLPLIISRLLLIEEVRSAAMDSVNADAFQEAYKDLVNLANLAMGGGQPVQ